MSRLTGSFADRQGGPGGRPAAPAFSASTGPVTDWTRPAPIYEYKLVGTTNALLHVERKVPDRPGLVLAIGDWLADHQLELEECVYSPCPGGVADVEVVAGGPRSDVLRALRAASGPDSLFDVAHTDASVPEKRHTARCTLYMPEGILAGNVLSPVGEAAFQPGAIEYPGLPYANISLLTVERVPYALGVPGYQVDVFLTADASEVLAAVLARLEAIREPMGQADAWTFRVWPCACPSCASEPA